MLFAPLLTAFAAAALLWGTVTSTAETCENEKKSKEWTVRGSEVTATGCTFPEGVNLLVKPMTRDAASNGRVVVDIANSDIVELDIDASNEGEIKMKIPFLLSVSNSNISKKVRIFGTFPYASNLTFSGNKMETTESLFITGIVPVVLSGSSTISFKDNTMTLDHNSFRGTSIWYADLTLEGNSSFVCSGNTVTFKINADSFDTQFLSANAANVLNSSIVLSDNTMTWNNEGKKRDVTIMNFGDKSGKCTGNNITITDNRIKTLGKATLKHLWYVGNAKNTSDITLDACGNSLNGSTLYDIGQNYLQPPDLAEFLVSDCPNPNPPPPATTGRNATSGVATTGTVLACFVSYLFLYLLF